MLCWDLLTHLDWSPIALVRKCVRVCAIASLQQPKKDVRERERGYLT